MTFVECEDGCKHSKVWTKQVLRYMKAVVFLVKGVYVVAKSCLKLIIFHDDLYR